MSAQQKIDEEDIVELIEDMIDARMAMREEKYYSNYHKYWEIKENQYDPLVSKLKYRLSKLGLDISQK